MLESPSFHSICWQLYQWKPIEVWFPIINMTESLQFSADSTGFFWLFMSFPFLLLLRIYLFPWKLYFLPFSISPITVPWANRDSFTFYIHFSPFTKVVFCSRQPYKWINDSTRWLHAVQHLSNRFKTQSSDEQHNFSIKKQEKTGVGKTHSWVFKSPTGGQVCEPCGAGSSWRSWFSMKWEAQVIHSCPNCTLKWTISAVSPGVQHLSAKKCHPLCTLKHHKFHLSPCFCLGCKSPEAAPGLGMGPG